MHTPLVPRLPSWKEGRIGILKTIVGCKVDSILTVQSIFAMALEQTSDIIGTVTKGDGVKYDAYSRHGDYVWIIQLRANDQPGYLVCCKNNDPCGEFK